MARWGSPGKSTVFFFPLDGFFGGGPWWFLMFCGSRLPCFRIRGDGRMVITPIVGV